MTGAALPTVLVIEDEPQIRRFLKTALEAHGYALYEADSGSQGLIEATTRRPDVVIVDLGLPDMEGVEVIRRLREWSSVPVIVLSARSLEDQKVAAFDAGADDYVTKPFGVGELIARLKVALRHAAGGNSTSGDSVFVSGDLKVDLAHRKVFAGGKEVHLTPIEYRLLSVLVKHAGKVLTHRQLLKDVWGPSRIEQNHYTRIYMAQLRHKIEAVPAHPRLLLTEPGVGYRLALV